MEINNKEKIDLPHISILIPTLNEAQHIARLLESIATGSYPIDKIEILILDANSNDSTREIAIKSAEKFNLDVKVIDNPKKYVPSALNLSLIHI